MSNAPLSDISKLEKAVETAKKKLNCHRFSASLLALSITLIWISVANGNESVVGMGIAFSGVTFMYWVLARVASAEYMNAVKELTEHSK